jgi:hypothetical protein
MKSTFVYLLLSLSVSLSVPVCNRAQEATPSPAASATLPASALPTVDQIVERAEKASGGKAAWSAITSMRIKGTVEIPAANATGTYESYSKAPNKSYQSVSIGGTVIMKEGFDGTSGWKVTPDQGSIDLQGEELDGTKLDSEFYSEVNLKQSYPQMVLQDDSTVGGRSSYTVLATPLHGKPRKFYFDKDSGLRIGMSSESTENGKTYEVKTYFEDFRNVQGVQVPYTIHLVTQNLTMVFHIREITANAPILNSTFLKPADTAIAAGPGSKASRSSDSNGPAAQPQTGGVSDHTYTNSTFGFSYTFPDGWTVHGAETQKEIMKVGKAMEAGNDPGRKAAFDAAADRTIQLLTVFQYPLGTPAKFNSSVQVMAEDVAFAPGIKTGKDYLLVLEIGMKRGTLPVEFADNITEFTVEGRQFFRLDDQLHLGAVAAHQAFISTKVGKYILSFILTSASQQDLEMLAGTLNSISFNKELN